MLVLFRTMTGEAWQDMLADTAVDNVTCGAKQEYGPCGSEFNTLYFVSFVLITNILVLNILLAIVVDSFTFLYQDPSILQEFHLSAFLTRWKKLDPTGTGKLHYTMLESLLKSLAPPLGVGKHCTDSELVKVVRKLAVPVSSAGMVEFRPTMVALIRMRLKLCLYDDMPDEDDLVEVMKFISPKTSREQIRSTVLASDGTITLRHIYSIVRIQRSVRELWRNRHRKWLLYHLKGQINDLAAFGKVPSAELSAEDQRELLVWLKAIKEALYSLILTINPHARLSLLLMLAHVDQIKAALNSEGNSRPLRAQWMYASGRLGEMGLTSGADGTGTIKSLTSFYNPAHG